MRIHGRSAAFPLVAVLVLAGCGAPAAATSPPDRTQPSGSLVTGEPAIPAWFDIEMTDVTTGQPFTINDFSGMVVLVEAMAEWCPTCVEQQREVDRLHDRLGGADDVVSISLDIDVHEDGPSLEAYAKALGHDWRYAVAPLEVARALGNLYSAEYLNPPYSPMLLIDRQGSATSLPYGVKTAEFLQTTLAPYLAP